MDDGTEAEHLALRIEHGDQSAEVALCERYDRGVRIVLRRGGCPADLVDDLCQDTFLTAIGQLRAGRLQDRRKLKPFVIGIARNILRDGLRKSRRRATSPDQERIGRMPSPDAGPFASLALDQQRWIVRKLLQELSVEEDADLLRAAFLEDLSTKELCERFGRTPQQIYMRKNRAVTRLVKLARQHGTRRD